MNKTLYIASCIKVCRSGIIDEEKLNAKLSTVAENSIGNACTGANQNPGAGERRGCLLPAVYDKN